jgi:hypothetical protein
MLLHASKTTNQLSCILWGKKNDNGQEKKQYFDFQKKMYQHNLSYMYCTVLNMHCGGKCHDDFTTLYFLAVYCSSALIYIHFHLIRCMWTTIQTRMRFIYNNYSLASNSHQRLAKISLWKWGPIDRKRTNFVKDHPRSKEHSSCVHCQMI